MRGARGRRGQGCSPQGARRGASCVFGCDAKFPSRMRRGTTQRVVPRRATSIAGCRSLLRVSPKALDPPPSPPPLSSRALSPALLLFRSPRSSSSLHRSAGSVPISFSSFPAPLPAPFFPSSLPSPPPLTLLAIFGRPPASRPCNPFPLCPYLPFIAFALFPASAAPARSNGIGVGRPRGATSRVSRVANGSYRTGAGKSGRKRGEKGKNGQEGTRTRTKEGRPLADGVAEKERKDAWSGV